MKRILLTLLFFITTSTSVNADVDYAKIYADMENPTFSYIHGIDPDQYYDTKNYAWSPYPLFRLNQEVYFKKQVIQPGYYLLTPSENEGKWYVLFKDNGIIKATIPCYKEEVVPAGFYKLNLPKEKLTPSARVHLAFINFVGHFNSSGRKQSPSTYLEVEDVDNDFISMTIYYGQKRYYILLRSKMLQN
ncbi:MAG: hypothetical protein ACI37S_08040 [Candidatus Gastranaerophilaceae bacterium]